MNPTAYIETSVVSYREAGYEPPVICTPNELMETGHGDDPA
ncbi:MAG: hypothetical protein OXF27_05410 [Acidobacteria bacterium]|nr:hypothetical protein [Acidobacteriota bacterium]